MSTDALRSFFVCVLTACHVGPDVLLKLRLLRMKRLLEEMSVPRTLSPTRFPWTLDTTSVVAPSSPASGCCLLLTATTRKCIKLTFETLLWIQLDLWLFSFTFNLPFLKNYQMHHQQINWFDTFRFYFNTSPIYYILFWFSLFSRQPCAGASWRAQHCFDWWHGAVDRCCQNHHTPLFQHLQPGQRHHVDQAKPPCHPQQLRPDRGPALPLHRARRKMHGVWMGEHFCHWS